MFCMRFLTVHSLRKLYIFKLRCCKSCIHTQVFADVYFRSVCLLPGGTTKAVVCLSFAICIFSDIVVLADMPRMLKFLKKPTVVQSDYM